MQLRAMIPYTPHPVLFSIGPVVIRYYSLAYLLGFVFGYVALRKRFGKERAEDLLAWIVLAIIVGGRLGYVFLYAPQLLWTDPFEILMIWHGGMSFHGGLIGLVGAIWLYSRRTRVSMPALLDTLAVPGALALGLGRIANFLNGELVGIVSDVPWCMVFPGYEGCRHPSQLYEALYSFALAAILYWQLTRTKVHKDRAGFIAALFVSLYGLFRFLANFLREDPRVLGLSEGQFLSLSMLVIGLWLLGTKYKSELRRCMQR